MDIEANIRYKGLGKSVDRVIDKDIVKEKEIDTKQIQELKKVSLKVAQRVKKYLDILKKGANLVDLLDKILDNELKGITSREVLSCSDLLQKLLFKNIVLFKGGSTIEGDNEASKPTT